VKNLTSRPFFICKIVQSLLILLLNFKASFGQALHKVVPEALLMSTKLYVQQIRQL
jgi:hypothetical protein